MPHWPNGRRPCSPPVRQAARQQAVGLTSLSSPTEPGAPEVVGIGLGCAPSECGSPPDSHRLRAPHAHSAARLHVDGAAVGLTLAALSSSAYQPTAAACWDRRAACTEDDDHVAPPLAVETLSAVRPAAMPRRLRPARCSATMRCTTSNDKTAGRPRTTPCARRKVAALTEAEAILTGKVSPSQPRFGRKPIPAEVQRFVWTRDGARCVNCCSQQFLEYDHIVPLSLGGSNTNRNVQLLCERCNRAKGARIGGTPTNG